MMRTTVVLVALFLVGLGLGGGSVALYLDHRPGTPGGPTFAVTGQLPMVVLAQAGDGNPDTFTSPRFVVLPKSTMTIRLSQREVVWYSVTAEGMTTGPKGEYAYLHVFLDGTDAAIVGVWDNKNPGYTSASEFLPLTTAPLARDTHTIDLRIAVDDGQTWKNYITGIDLFGPGSGSSPVLPGGKGTI